MTGHVPPDAWASLARVPDVERDAILEHVATCDRCALVRRRVEGAMAAMRDVGAAPPPSLNWEHVGARLYWSVSSELRQRDRDRGVRRSVVARVSPYALVGAAAAAGVSLLFLVRTGQQETVGPPPPPAKPPTVIELTVNPVRPARPAPIQGVVTLLSGEVRVGGAPLTVDAAIRAGDKIETGAGRLAVQFGERSAFELGPRTTVEVRAFDERDVVLAVTGTIDVDAEKRHDGERLEVVAGSRTVEVRGTAFRVGHDDGDDLRVAVTRGRVAVVEGASAVEVPAGTQLSLTAGTSLSGVAPRALIQPGVPAPRALGRIPMVPTWTDVDNLRTHTAVLSVAAPPRVAVRVDGVELGKGSFALRTTPGRHLVEGGVGAPRWVEVEQGTASAGTTSVSLSQTGASESERPAQVDAELRRHRGRFFYCGDRMRKAEPGFTGSIQVEIGIEADGSVRFVAPVEGVDDPDVETCVLDVIRTLFTFPPGSKATVQKVIRF